MSISKEFQGVSSCYVFKSRLQEYAQKNKFLAPVYETLKEGPPHEPCFRSSVIVNDFKFDSLPGFCNRKAAEQSAAEVALVELAKLGNTDDSIRNPVHESGLCKNLLQEYAQKMNYAVPSYVCRMSETRGKVTSYTSTVDIGGIKYIGAAARTKKEAKLKAARTALLAIQSSTYGSRTNPSGDCQLTVVPPIKKAPEPAAAVDITKKSLKPRKNRLKKRWQKKKFLKKNDDQVTTDPTGEASGSTVAGNAGNCDEIHAQGSGVLDAHMNDQSMQNITSSNGSGIESFPTEEASGHTLNTSDTQTLGSAAEETMMDMDIRTTQDVGSTNGSGLERLPAGEVCGVIVVRNTDNTTEIQAHHGAAAAETHLDMDIQSTQIGGLADGSGLERMTTGEASGNTENTNKIQAQGLGETEADVNPRFVQIGGSENRIESGGETLLAEAKLTYQEIKMEVQNDQGFSRNCESENGTGSGLQRLSAEANQSFSETNLEVQGFSQNGSRSGLLRLPEEKLLAEAKLTYQEIKMEVQNDQGFSRSCESENGTGSGLQRLSAEANQSFPETNLEVLDQGFSQNGSGSGLLRLPEEEQTSLQEIVMQVQNGQGVFQIFELQNGSTIGLEPNEAQKSLQEINVGVENSQGFLQNFELQNGTASGLDGLPAEAQKSLQEIEMELQNDEGFLQNSELQDATASGLERFPAEAQKSFQEIKMEVENDQGFLQNSELQNGTASGLEWFPAEAQKSLQEIEMEVENDQGFLQNSELQNGTASGLERFLDEKKQSFQDTKTEVQNDQGFSM